VLVGSSERQQVLGQTLRPQVLGQHRRSSSTTSTRILRSCSPG
jgi:hypothetical protein